MEGGRITAYTSFRGLTGDGGKGGEKGEEEEGEHWGVHWAWAWLGVSACRKSERVEFLRTEIFQRK